MTLLNKVVGRDIVIRFSNLDKCRPEVASDVMCGMALDDVGADVQASFGDYRLNSGRIIRLCPAGPVLHTFVEFCIAFCSRQEAASYVISNAFVKAIVPDKCVKLCGPRLNRSREIPPEAVGGDISHRFFSL